MKDLLINEKQCIPPPSFYIKPLIWTTFPFLQENLDTPPKKEISTPLSVSGVGGGGSSGGGGRRSHHA